jgi:hypothetical protein
MKPWLTPHLTAEQRAAAFFSEVGMRGDVGDLAEAFERHAQDAIWNSDLKENLRKAILLLDVAMPHFERVAMLEAGGGQGSPLRQVTCQKRLEAVQDMVKRVGPTVGYDNAI